MVGHDLSAIELSAVQEALNGLRVDFEALKNAIISEATVETLMLVGSS